VGLEKGHFVLPLALPVSLTNRKQFLALKPTSKGIISNDDRKHRKNKQSGVFEQITAYATNIYAKKFPGIYCKHAYTTVTSTYPVKMRQN